MTLKTEVEAGASGFSVTGGGDEGIFIKKVLKESPASKVFSLREGTVLFSNLFFFKFYNNQAYISVYIDTCLICHLFR